MLSSSATAENMIFKVLKFVLPCGTLISQVLIISIFCSENMVEIHFLEVTMRETLEITK